MSKIKPQIHKSRKIIPVNLILAMGGVFLVRLGLIWRSGADIIRWE